MRLYTCADTFAVSHLNRTSEKVGWAANYAEDKKTPLLPIVEKNSFFPVASDRDFLSVSNESKQFI